jgi:hypothetical protein
MKKFVIILVLCITGVLQLKAQDQKQKKDPDEQIIVNKKFDENGNLIQYDSTYVHQWSSDSTMNFSFGNQYPNLMDQSIIDSMLHHFGLSSNFGFSPFNDEDFFEQFGQMFPDSKIMDDFNLQSDSLPGHNINPHAQIPDFFNSPDFNQWQKQLQQQLKQYNEFMPNFQNDEQRKEWEELMKKQKKEQDEFMQKLNEGKE